MAAPRVRTDNRTGGSSEHESQTHHSLALKHSLRRFRALGGSRVLELGPAIGRNVQFLSAFISKLFIADLYSTIWKQAGQSGMDGVKLDRILARDLPGPDEDPVDLILAWDLLNYLDRDQVATLGRHLARLCHRETLMLILLSTLPAIPELPGRHLMLDPETIRYENQSKRQRRSPAYKEPDLERLMPAFEVETSFLLRSGTQEYVMTTRSLG